MNFSLVLTFSFEHCSSLLLIKTNKEAPVKMVNFPTNSELNVPNVLLTKGLSVAS